MKLSRRSLLGLLAISGGVISYGGYSLLRSKFSGPSTALKIPEQYLGELKKGVCNFDLAMQQGISQFLKALTQLLTVSTVHILARH